MPSEENMLLKFIQYQNLVRHQLYFLYILNLWLKKTVVSKNNTEKLSTTKLAEHVWCGYSISTIWVFNGIEDKHAECRGEDCMKKFLWIFKRACNEEK